MEYEIKGGAFPMVICKLEKGETMKNEGGSMAIMTSKIRWKVVLEEESLKVLVEH